jgi:glycerol-3-phosphate dehydrogenase subunit B
VRPEAVVVGAGLAGLTAALRLAEGGTRTTLVTKGVGATHLSPAGIDVLGYAPDLVERPASSLPAFVSEHPEHPYARISSGTLAASAAWLVDRVSQLEYVGTLEENMFLPTAVGVPKPTAFAPASMAAGDLRSGGRFAFVGLRALKDFYPTYLADNLSQAKLPSGVTVEARAVQLLDPGEEADVSPLGYARMFEDQHFRRAVASDLGPRLEPDETVGFPAVLGLDQHRSVRLDLQETLGRPVFEVPTLPPSVTGIRLYRQLLGAFLGAGGRQVIGAVATGAETDGRRVQGIVVQAAAPRPTIHEAGWFVLATGGFAEGALALDSGGRVTENVFGIPVSWVPGPDETRFDPLYFADQPMARAGLAVDDQLRPVGLDGTAAFENLFAAGAVIGGAVPWRELSGNGVALATGYAAAGRILEASS